MNRFIILLLLTLAVEGCRNYSKSPKRIAIAKAGDTYLYMDQVPKIIPQGASASDSSTIIQNYINTWAKRELLYQKAAENLTPELNDEIEKQLNEARINLTIYQYQQQMMLEKMDTMVTNQELEDYYNSNQSSFMLSTNIVKALFIRLPEEIPNAERIKQLARSDDQSDLLKLETICYQFADKFDDFDERWIPLDRISVELPEELANEESFLRRTKFYEANDSTFLYLLNIRDYRLRASLSPFEYVKDDVKRIIWNTRRIQFLQSLENGIYNDAIKEDRFTVINK